MSSIGIEGLCAQINAEHADRVNKAADAAIDALVRTMTLGFAAEAYAETHAETLSTLAEQCTGTQRARERRR